MPVLVEVAQMGNALGDPRVGELVEGFLEQDPEHAIVLLDPQGRIVGWLGAAPLLFGYRTDEVRGRHISGLFTPDDRAKGQAETEMEVARRTGRSEDDRWHVREDGTAIFVAGTLTALRNRQGELTGFAKVMRDRTNLRTQTETLENRIEGLMQKLESASLLLNTLGHEVRNPLGPLANAVALLERQPAGASSTLPLTIVRRQIAVLERLSSDLMDFSRLGAGKLELRCTPFVLQALIGEIVESLQQSAREREQALVALLPEAPIAVSADRERLQQVIVNLIDNALKYTGRGGQVTVRAVEEPPHAVVHVEDNGIGIAPELLPRIFELFTQGSGPVGAEPKGLGVGLALVKDLVELHGGTIDARSAGVGKGAEFSVRIPTRTAPRFAPRATP